METLHLTLKKKWFDLIESGAKTEEYREIKEYWCRRIGKGKCNNRIVDNLGFDLKINCLEFYNRCFALISPDCLIYNINYVVFRNGYAKDAPKMEFKIKEITIGRGDTELGAPTDRDVFIIKLGEKVK